MKKGLIREKKVTLKEMVERFELDVLYEGNLNYSIDEPSIYRSGPELTGYFEEKSGVLEKYIHILGKEEVAYLKKLSVEERERILKKYLSFSFPAVLITHGAIADDETLKALRESNKTVLTSKKPTSDLIRKMKHSLQKILSPEMLLDGHVLIEVMGIGVLLKGDTDAVIGSTVELIESGHKYIGDRKLLIKKTGEKIILGINGRLYSRNRESSYLTNKDGSKIDVTNTWGISATRSNKEINLVITLEPWDHKKFYDRLGIDDVYEEFLGVKIQSLTLPVRKGRNLSNIIETAAMNSRLKHLGRNSAKEFLDKTKNLIEKNKVKNKGGSMKEERKFTVGDLVRKNKLEILNGHDNIEDTLVCNTSIHRPSLALSGYYDTLEEGGPDKIQIFSPIEFEYLDSLDNDIRMENLKKYLSYPFPAIVLSQVEEVPRYFLKAVREADLILLRCYDKRTSQIIADFNFQLTTFFAPTITMHGVFVEMYGFGVLLTGKSGIGKSETALELIHRGHRLVADDLVKFKKDGSGDIVGQAARVPHFMEIRGLGIIDVKTLYGLGAVRMQKRLDAVLELKEQKTDDYLSTAKFSGEEMEILEESVYKAELSISSGRNAAAMVEVATMNLMAKRMGYDPEKSYGKGLEALSKIEMEMLKR